MAHEVKSNAAQQLEIRMDPEIVHVSAEGRERLDELVNSVAAILARAGIPVLRSNEAPQNRPGALITVDTIADSAGGVYVKWCVHPQ